MTPGMRYSRAVLKSRGGSQVIDRGRTVRRTLQIYARVAAA